MIVKECSQIVRCVPLPKQTFSAERRIIPIDDTHRLLRFRAIANLCKGSFNGNYDGFPYEYFEDSTPGYGYKSFIGKRAHHEHNSALGITGSIGDLPDAFLNKFLYPSSVPHRDWSKLGGRANASLRQSILDLPEQRAGDIEVLMRLDTTLTKNSSTDAGVRKALDRILRAIDNKRNYFARWVLMLSILYVQLVELAHDLLKIIATICGIVKAR